MAEDDIFSHLGDDDRTVLSTKGGPAVNTGGGDKTIIRPTPGGKRPGGSTVEIPAVGGVQRTMPTIAIDNLHNLLDKTDNNPVLSVAKPLLSLLTRLSQTHQHNDVNGLHARTIQEIKKFEMTAQHKGIDPQQTIIARYVLCAAIDEMVLNTPWGSNSQWPSQSMLSTFHRETSGGQKFFTLLERMQQNPGANINLLELVAICLALGFQGKYRVVQGGLSYIETIRSQLHQQIAMIRGEYERELSPHSEGIHIKRAVDRNIPIWVVGAITAAIIIATYIGFSIALNNNAKPILEKLNQINAVQQTTIDK